jgi:hypothetical protein
MQMPQPRLIADATTDAMVRIIENARLMGGVCWPLEKYCNYFGAPSQRYPWGEQVFTGMMQLFKESQKYYYGGLTERSVGYFRAPAPFSKARAQLPTSCDEWQETRYPTIATWSPDWGVYIYCMAILMNNGRAWSVHWTRFDCVYTLDVTGRWVNQAPAYLPPAHWRGQDGQGASSTAQPQATIAAPVPPPGLRASTGETP